jgi:hypothetical protein
MNIYKKKLDASKKNFTKHENKLSAEKMKDNKYQNQIN